MADGGALDALRGNREILPHVQSSIIDSYDRAVFVILFKVYGHVSPYR